MHTKLQKIKKMSERKQKIFSLFALSFQQFNGLLLKKTTKMQVSSKLGKFFFLLKTLIEMRQKIIHQQ